MVHLVREYVRFLLKIDGKKRAVAILVKNENKYLGVSRGKGSNEWGFPGGHVEPGETFEQAAKRELKEETGLDGDAFVPLFRSISAGFHDTVTFKCSVSGKLKASSEGDVSWHPLKFFLDEKNSPFVEYTRKLFKTCRKL
jgi:8-oxo-dGTP pyrophosphatase MutT (NUDIX family)